MGMTYRDFLDLTPRQFVNAVGGFFDREQAKIKEQWEQIRWMGAVVASKPVYGYKIKPISPIKMLPLPWDTDTELPDKDTLEDLRNKMNEWQTRH